MERLDRARSQIRRMVREEERRTGWKGNVLKRFTRGVIGSS